MTLTTIVKILKMKETLLMIFCVISMTTWAQTKSLPPSIQSVTGTGISVESYSLNNPENAFQLALNFSFTNHINTNCKHKNLFLPIVLIDDKTVSKENLENIKISDIKEYNFQHKGIANFHGTYGTSYGVLFISLKKK